MRLALVCFLVAASGCATERAVDRVVERTATPSERTFDLPDTYDIVDVGNTTALVALDEDPDPWDVRERTTVEVFARHRETGEEALFVYDLMRDGAAPSTVVRFRRVSETPASRSEDAVQR